MKIEKQSTPEQIIIYINGLKNLVLQGGPERDRALEELSGAAYDNPHAREAIREIEEHPLPSIHIDRERHHPDDLFSSVLHAGEVPLSAWPITDQERMAHGLLPKHHPEHPNV